MIQYIRKASTIKKDGKRGTRMIVIICFGIFGLIISAVLAGMYLIFTKFHRLTAKTYAKLTKIKHIRNVRVSSGFPGSRSWIAKHYTKSIHIYTVGNKTYKIRDHHLSTPKQVPTSIKVIYIKKLPFIRCIDTPENINQEIYFALSIAVAFFSALFFLLAILI